MIHILNNSQEKYGIILNRLEKHLTSYGSDVLMKDIICNQLNDRFEKWKKKDEKKLKEKALTTYWKQYKCYCSKCETYGHKLTN